MRTRQILLLAVALLGGVALMAGLSCNNGTSSGGNGNSDPNEPGKGVLDSVVSRSEAHLIQTVTVPADHLDSTHSMVEVAPITGSGIVAAALESSGNSPDQSTEASGYTTSSYHSTGSQPVDSGFLCEGELHVVAAASLVGLPNATDTCGVSATTIVDMHFTVSGGWVRWTLIGSTIVFTFENGRAGYTLTEVNSEGNVERTVHDHTVEQQGPGPETVEPQITLFIPHGRYRLRLWAEAEEQRTVSNIGWAEQSKTRFQVDCTIAEYTGN